MVEQRENWGTRAGFILAAIGSAVGLGNLWGFPYKLYSFGGGAFLIPYLLAMAIIGVPLMIMEFSLGHLTQRSAPQAFGRIGRRLEAVGWWQILLGFVIITYYAVVLAWCVSYLGYSIQGIFNGGELPWAGRGVEGVNKAREFFFGKYLNSFGSAEQHTPYSLGSPAWWILVSLAVVWLAMYLCIFRGVRLVGKVVLWTVPLPWLMLAILTIRGLTLDGAVQGLEYYLEPHWSQLAKPATWRWAFGQVFFSMSLGFGVMITYASFLHRRSDLNNNAMVIGLADMGTSFVAGIAVFATLGGMSAATALAGAYVPVEKVAQHGPSLAFVAFPYALAQLPYSAWFSAVFFIALLTLGIDSAFSITESVLASIVDKTGWSRNVVLPVMSIIGFAAGVVFCTRGGLSWLGSIDGFINGTWGIVLLGLMETLVLGWMYRISVLRRHANERSDWRLGRWWDWLIRVVVPVVLASLFTWNLFEDLTKPHFIRDAGGGINWYNVIGLGIMAAAPVAAVLISLRSARRTVEPEPLGSDRAYVGPITGRAMGAASLLLAAGAAAMLVLAGKELLRIYPALKAAAASVDVKPLVVLLVVSGLAAVLGVVCGALAVHSAEKNIATPSYLARFGAGLGVVAIGAAAGMALTLFTLRHKLKEVEFTYDKQLSPTAYVLLGGILLLMFGGLLWCFYRAMRAASLNPDNGPNAPPGPA